MLRALQHVAKKANAAGKSLTLCGEIGGRPLEAMALIALGYRGLSMSASSIGPVKAMLLALDAQDVTNYVNELLERRDGCETLRPSLMAYAESKGVPL